MADVVVFLFMSIFVLRLFRTVLSWFHLGAQ